MKTSTERVVPPKDTARAASDAPERPAPRPSPRAKRGEIVEPLQLRHELRDFERFPVSTLLKAAKPAVYEQCVETMRRAREFTERHVVDRVEAWDRQASKDHGFVPWPAIDAALPYGFLSLNIPGVLGGGNYGPMASGVFAEEVAAADAGVYVIYGAHSLALALVLASLDLPLMARIGREISEGEKQGKAVVLALAHTEPGGGSDVEDVEDINRGRLGSRYEKVPGGYKVNARNVFISNGSIARYHVLTAFGDMKRPLETMRAFLIAQDSPGLSIGRCERKLGQRLSTAVEILCDDVFVPDDAAIHLGNGAGARVIDTTLSLTRGPVGAMATGIIRGTIERTLAYLSQKRVRGHWLFEEQWVTLALADMLGALQASRGLYMDSSIAAEAWGVCRGSSTSSRAAFLRPCATIPSTRGSCCGPL